MSAAPMIQIDDLHKQYVLREGSTLKNLLLMKKRHERRFVRDVLRGITFDVAKGECVAVIGKNGTGKSTLLSILARVHKPTKGSVSVNGRVAPMLELGSGFHPDLTGRENVEFNAMLLGLTGKQIQERMESIIDFSGIREYIDSPIRTYSSGMIARLGFSVVSHVDADILLIDEALAVGDFEFVQKCFTRLTDFKKAGGTILFVTHVVSSVNQLADRCIWLEDGLIRFEGDPKEAIALYQGDAPSPPLPS